MQQTPLLEQLDWFFTTVNWTTTFPNTLSLPLAKTTSDHVPCKVSIGTSIPRSNIFRFENFWPQCTSYAQVVEEAWNGTALGNQVDILRGLDAKFRQTTQALKR